MQEMTVRSIMDKMNAEVLKKIARLLDVDKKATRKADIMEGIASCINLGLRQVLAKCSETEKLALAEAAFGGGRLDRNAFWGKYGMECPTLRSSYSHRETPSPFCLLIGVDDMGILRVADGIAEPLQRFLPAPPQAAVKVVEDELPNMHAGRNVNVHSGERIVFLELRRILGLAQAGKLAVTAKLAIPTDACARRIGEALMLPDLDLEEPENLRSRWYTAAGPVRAYAWGVLVQQCGWCKATGSKLELTRKGRKMLADGGIEALKEGLSRLLNDDNFDELNRINHIRGQTGKGKRSMTRPSSRRLSIADAMLDWPEGQWMDFNDAFQFVCASGNTFSVTRSDAWGLYFCEKQYGSLGYADEGRGDGLERQYMRVFMVETLATLGIVDIAYVYPHGLWPELGGRWGTDDLAFCGRYDGLRHVRLTALGAYCLGITDAYAMPVEKAASLVKVLPNLELVITNDAVCSPADTARLELFASPRNERVWQIDSRPMLAHIESGGSMDDIRKELESVSDGSIPETVGTFLDETERKATALKCGQPCILVDVADKATAALIAHDPNAGKHCLLAGDRHVAVLAKNERAFRTAVKNLGYVLPR